MAMNKFIRCVQNKDKFSYKYNNSIYQYTKINGTLFFHTTKFRRKSKKKPIEKSPLSVHQMSFAWTLKNQSMLAIKHLIQMPDFHLECNDKKEIEK